MKYVHKLNERYSARISVSGGKGANLNKLVRYGFNVPEGIIVNSIAFDDFVRYNYLSSIIKDELTYVRIDDYNSISIASNNIKNEILKSPIPLEILSQIERHVSMDNNQTYAVRSSGVFEDNYNNSWAGLFDSFLQVNKNDLGQTLKKCWASFFNSRAISYNIRAYKNIKNLKFAVIIQKMVLSEKSGVAFSIEPRENDLNKILIEASQGSGENLVSGKEIPFTAIIDKKKKLILNKSIKNNQFSELLSNKELKELTNQILKLEKRFEQPVDIEWAYSENLLYFLQIRPITGLGRITKSRKKFTTYPAINEYELTFNANGLSFLFTDMLSYSYKYLDPLFIYEQSRFSQYIKNEKIVYASRSGLNWLSKPKGFEDYQYKFTKYYNESLIILDDIVYKRNLTKSSTLRFFQILIKIFRLYSRMDVYFTNLSFIYAEENPIINKNHVLLSKFKDEARLWINTISFEKTGQFPNFITRLAQEYSLAESDLERYKISELLTLFNGMSSIVSEKEIENRKQSFTIYYFTGQLSYLTGTKSLDYISKVTNREDNFNASEIKGLVANRVQKIIQGRVRVINIDYSSIEKMNREISAMEKGEILVSEFTAPELIRACRKAKAIITDLGGMLSHAAIISRELKIPCLVATHKASKILKTGEKIIIDFDLGSVTRIPT